MSDRRALSLGDGACLTLSPALRVQIPTPYARVSEVDLASHPHRPIHSGSRADQSRLRRSLSDRGTSAHGSGPSLRRANARACTAVNVLEPIDAPSQPPCPPRVLVPSRTRVACPARCPAPAGWRSHAALAPRPRLPFAPTCAEEISGAAASPRARGHGHARSARRRQNNNRCGAGRAVRSQHARDHCCGEVAEQTEMCARTR